MHAFSNQQLKSSICAVVVSYHPELDIIDNILLLLDQVDEVIVVDNGSGPSTRELLGFFDSYPRVKVIFNTENLGVAAALNIGVMLAEEARYPWLATFDQDSRVTPGMIEQMLLAYHAYQDKEKIAILSPRCKDRRTGRFGSTSLDSSDGSGLLYSEVIVAITSGNLVKLTAFSKIGYFNEAMFIDYVDYEFCLRCAAQGYKVLEIPAAILEHSLGFQTTYEFFWKSATVTNHSALRRCYNTRNRIYVYKRFALSYPLWFLNDAFAFLKEIFKLMLYEKHKGTKLIAVFRGIVYGFCGRMGKL